MANLVRLNKYLADVGVGSRRSVDKLIEAGDVSVNGAPALLGMLVDPRNDKVEFRGHPITMMPTVAHVYYALYKPRGVVSTASDESGRESVVDLVPEEPRVYPVGRLDIESEGLIILTNDGELTQRLTHPRFEHEKEYWVRARIMSRELRARKDIAQYISTRLLSGLDIDGHIMRVDSASVSLVPDSPFVALTLVLHTGYNRQIRKMCDKIGLSIDALIRTRVGKLKLDDLDLKPGSYKEITKDQIL
ncbi:MAG: pseudouridine synthase [Patescibacteria group bacterium]|jgi:23S rRNA pseudouridine2605 synthase